MGAITGNASMPGHNLRISPDGNFYESSKEPREGFVEHVSSVTKQVSYWKEYYKGLFGELAYIAVKEVTFNNAPTQIFTLGFKDSGEMWFISMPLVKQSGSLNNYVKDFIKKCPNIDITKPIFINPSKRKKGEEYAPGSFYIAYWNEVEQKPGELIPHFWKNGQNGLPDRKEYTGFGGKITYDYRDQDNFLYNKLVEFINKFNSIKQEQRNTQQAQQAPQQQYSAPTAQPTQQPQPTTQTGYGNPPAEQPAYQQAPPSYATVPPEYNPQDDDLPF